MKHLRSVILPGIAVVTLVVLALSGSTGASAAILPQHTHGPATCGEWSKVASPNVNNSLSDSLSGVAAIAANDVWAVGAISGNNIQALTEHWNGSAWSVVKSPSPGSENNGLAAAARVPATSSIWAVGFKLSNGIYQTLTEFYC